MLAHPSTKPSLSNIVIVLNIITFFIVKTNVHDLKRLSPIALCVINGSCDASSVVSLCVLCACHLSLSDSAAG